MQSTETAISAEQVAMLTVEAESAVAREDWRGAAAAYEKLVANHPKDPAHRFSLVRVYDELGDAEQALRVLKHPSIAHLDKTKRRLARTYMELKDYAAAMPLVDELLAADPRNPKFEKWKAVLDEKSGPDSSAAERMQQGRELFESGCLHQAEELFLELIRDYPGFARASVYLGKVYVEQKRWAEAIPPLRSGLAAEPANSKLKNTLARALFKDGQVRAAMVLLESGEGSGDDIDALILLQRCQFELNNWKLAGETGERLLGMLPPNDPLQSPVGELTEEAAVRNALEHIAVTADPIDADTMSRMYREVAARHPRSPLPWLALGAVLADAGRHGEAAASLRDGRAAHPANLDIRTALTRTVINLGDDKATLRHVKEAAADHGGDFEALRWLARHHAEREEWEETVEPARRALELEPRSAAPRVALVHALLHLGRLAESLEQLDPLLESGEKQVEALRLKGDILLRLSRLNDAIRAYQEAAALAPKDPELTRRLAAALLLSGDVEGFHRWHERRRERPESPELPEWSGELVIEGKLLVWASPTDSVGAQVLQLRFLRHLLALGFELVVAIDERLIDICRRSFPQVTAIACDGELPDGIVRQTALDGLFRWFKPDLQSLGAEQPYLIPGAGVIKAERARIEAGERQLVIGVDWPGNELMEAIASPRTELIDLRAEVPTPDQLGAMDLVICGDGDVAHLAGALGIPTLVILPPLPSPYWLAAGDRCVWYPSVRLLRRSPVDDGWSATIAEAAAIVGDFESGTYRPTEPRARELAPAELAEAARCFIAQGPQHYPAYRSALALIERVPDEHRSRELKVEEARLLVRLGEWRRARTLLESMRPTGEPNRDLESLILSVCLAMYDLDAALPIARAMAMDDPAFGVTAANILFHAGRNAEALAQLKAVAVVAPDSERVSSLLGTLLLEAGQPDRAVAYLAGQVAASHSAADYTLLGRALAELGDQQEAMAAFDAAITASPDDPAANYWRTRNRIASGAAGRTELPALEGEVPDVAPDDRVIFFVADNAYFWEHARVLLASITRQSPTAKCHIHVVNPGADVAAALDQARKALPGLSYSHERADFGGCDDTHVRTYYASIRFVRLAEIFAHAPATYLCIDSDCIVRRDVTAAPLPPGDVGIRLRYSDEPHASVAAGALVLRPTPAAGKFADRVAELISSVLETGEAAWFLDQVVLSQTVRELGHGEVRFAQIDMAYVDWFFRDEALIWTGKGPRKFEDDRYVAEASYYRDLVETDG
jgi:predicted Zn-dependent protease